MADDIPIKMALLEQRLEILDKILIERMQDDDTRAREQMALLLQMRDGLRAAGIMDCHDGACDVREVASAWRTVRLAVSGAVNKILVVLFVSALLAGAVTLGVKFPKIGMG